MELEDHIIENGALHMIDNLKEFDYWVAHFIYFEIDKIIIVKSDALQIFSD